MVLKLTLNVRNVIFFFYKPKIRWNCDILNFFGKIFILFSLAFGMCFTENRLFWGSAMFMTSLWTNTWFCSIVSTWLQTINKILNWSCCNTLPKILGTGSSLNLRIFEKDAFAKLQADFSSLIKHDITLTRNVLVLKFKIPVIAKCM